MNTETKSEVKHDADVSHAKHYLPFGSAKNSIVRKLSLHDELVAAVKVFLADFKKSSGFDDGLASENSETVIAMAETLLAKAEAR